MKMLPLIEAKREGRELSPAQVREAIAAFTAGEIPDYQMAAFLMAVCFRGLSAVETRSLTLAMRESGEVLEFPADSRPLVDKHSTGGIGDKVSLPLAPLLACLGFRVPMISGRGLGITGGTLDKLDAIPGFQTRLSTAQIRKIVQRVGCVICGQTDRMVPADKRIYSLRDATGTVPSIPLIVASILSKKLAEGLDALVLDVKFGAAAFMPTARAAGELARAMVKLGTECGVNTRALLTRMDTPVGRTAGNWLEVKEAVACLESGAGACRPTDPEIRDLTKLVVVSAAHLLVQTRKAGTVTEALQLVNRCLSSGQPRRKWDEMLAAQGADLKAFQRKLAQDHLAPVLATVRSTGSGFVSQCDARIIGEVVRDLGAGRQTQEAAIDPEVGVDQLAKPGDQVKVGDPLVRVHARDKAAATRAKTRLARAFKITSRKPSVPPLVLRTLMKRA